MNTFAELLVERISNAIRIIVCDLMKTEEQFYYFALITTGEGHCPVFSAWSKEALHRQAATAGNYAIAQYDLKWSASDSPYYAKNNDEWDPVEAILSPWRAGSGSLSEENWHVLMNAMVEAAKRLDAEGVFGLGSARSHVFVNCEVVPPDQGNVDRARALNPSEAFEWYMQEQEEGMP